MRDRGSGPREGTVQKPLPPGAVKSTCLPTRTSVLTLPGKSRSRRQGAGAPWGSRPDSGTSLPSAHSDAWPDGFSPRTRVKAPPSEEVAASEPTEATTGTRGPSWCPGPDRPQDPGGVQPNKACQRAIHRLEQGDSQALSGFRVVDGGYSVRPAGGGGCSGLPQWVQGQQAWGP